MARVLLVIGLVAVLVGCGALVMLVNEFTGQALNEALRENDTPDTAQKVTAVCIGLNLGSCRTSQESTTTARPAGSDPNPWPVVLWGVALLCPVVFMAALSFHGREVGR